MPTTQSLHHLYARSEAAGYSCGRIKNRLGELTEAVSKAEAAIAANRPRNQIAGFFAALFILPIVATEMNDDERGIVAHAQTELDLLRYSAQIKRCT